MAKITLLTDFNCKICNREFKNSNGLGRHLYLTHNMKSEDYTLQYLLHNKFPKCKCGCEKELKIGKYSYYEYQSGHAPQTPESNDWKNDKSSEKYKNYFKKLSTSMKKFHAENPMSIEKRLEMSNNRKKFIEDNPEIMRQMLEKSKNIRRLQKESGILRGDNHYFNKMTDEEKAEVIKKRMKTYENMSDEEWEIISKNISNGLKKYWSNLSPERKKERAEISRSNNLNLSEERKQEISRNRSISRKAEMERLGTSDKFKPSFNEMTIPYIENILNVEYNTKFIHAKCDTGEFKIYDRMKKRTYYADAYSKELNLWIEFDEPNKFNNGILKENHIERQNRIKKCLDGVEIVRIYFDKNEQLKTVICE